LDKVPDIVRSCIQFLQSEAFFLILSNLTGLRLHHLAVTSPDNDEEEEPCSADVGQGVIAYCFSLLSSLAGVCNNTELVQLTLLRIRLLSNPNALVSVSKGMWVIKLCTNRVLQFLTGGAIEHRLTCIVAVKQLLLLLLLLLSICLHCVGPCH